MCSAHLACRWLGRLSGKLYSTAFSGPPLGRPAWLCPGPAKMEKKIAAKMLLTSVEIESKMLPGGSKSFQNGSKGLQALLGASLLGALGALLRDLPKVYINGKMGRPGSPRCPGALLDGAWSAREGSEVACGRKAKNR